MMASRTLERTLKAGRRFAWIALGLDLIALPFFFSWTLLALLFFGFTILGLIVGGLAILRIGAVRPYATFGKVVRILGLVIPGVNILVLFLSLSDADYAAEQLVDAAGAISA